VRSASRPTPNLEDQASIFKAPVGQGDPVVSPGTGSPFWSPFTTRMSYGGAILIPRPPHGENFFHYWLQISD
jgi:hypothetical protein